VRAVRPVRMMSLTRIGGVERRANTGARLTFSSGAAGAKVPIELLGLLKGKESRCGGYGGAHARYRHAARYVARHSRPARSPIFIRRDLRPGQTGNPSQLLPLAKAAAQSANSPDFGHSHPSAPTSSPARPKKCVPPRCEPQRNPQGLSPIGPEAGRKFATDLYGL